VFYNNFAGIEPLQADTSSRDMMKRMLEAQYAPQEREDKSIISGAKAKYAEENERARHEDLMSQALARRARTEASYGRDGGSGGGKKQYAPSGLAKLMLERNDVEEGFLPGSNRSIELTPEQQEEYMGRLDLQIQKTSTDVKTRDKSLQASNLQKSMDALNTDDITRYSGPKGAIKLKYEQAKDLAGNPSEEYLRYKEALIASEYETSELRQFFGDSITPQVREHLQMLSNPSALNLSPEAARKQIEKSRAIIAKQLKTYTESLKSTKPYKGKEEVEEQEAAKISKALTNAEQGAMQPPIEEQSMQGTPATVTIRNPRTGETKTIPFQEAMRMGLMK